MTTHFKLNNIYLEHKNIDISIAQHRNVKKADQYNSEEDIITCQEVAYGNKYYLFHDLDTLIDALNKIKYGV
tara:strand:+ start:309 stop:524 length:216 start_codon:yes stop_codon:yes gene_type:complete